jgi:methyl-accepting chemotaxis protein
MKTTSLASRAAGRPAAPSMPMAPAAPRRPHRKPAGSSATSGRQRKIEERIAAATDELAAGISEAASACEQLRRAMEQIASGADEAASASQQTLVVAGTTAAALVQARERAEITHRRTRALLTLLGEAVNQIGAWAGNIKQNGERQAGSVAIIEQLSQQAVTVGEVTTVVGQVSDQTGLLALNAAIEAARAGDHGRGFAVVADEVRALAESSERSARQVQVLVSRIQKEVATIVATIKTAAAGAAAESEKSQTVILALAELRKEVAALGDSSQQIATGAMQAEAAAREAQKGAELISSAAEEQAASAAEALRSIEQQTAALIQSQRATQALAALANDFATSGRAAGRADVLASSAEQLSTTVQEISAAAQEILLAMEQTSRGGQQQASATQQASAALNQIEKTAHATQDNAVKSLERTKRIEAMLAEVRIATGDLSAGVARSGDTTRQSLGMIASLEAFSRDVEKIVDGIAIVSIQTNMLAVTGSVEAARASDFGKGFAVVSKDIRNLAQDSGENAGRIKDTVRVIQNQLAEVRRELEQIIAATETENRKSAGIASSLDLVERDMAEVALSNNQIVDGAKSILASIAEGSRGAQQIATAAEEAGSAASEAAAAAREQARGAEDLAAAIEEIASLADEIQRHG